MQEHCFWNEASGDGVLFVCAENELPAPVPLYPVVANLCKICYTEAQMRLCGGDAVWKRKSF